MSKFKGTPGPWEFDREGGDYPQWIEGSVSGLTVVSGCGCCGSPNLGVEDAQAISAVPELLEALEELLYGDTSKAKTKAASALAKAYGEMNMATITASYAYDLIDRYLRNNMDDDTYAEYSELRGSVYPAPVEQSAMVVPAYRSERGSDGELTYEAKAWNAALDEVARLNAGHLRGCSEMIAPFNLQEFARVAALEMEKHDFHGFEPVVLSVVEGLLSAPPAAAVVPDMNELANFIRQIDGNNRMGAGVLAERICDWFDSLNPTQVEQSAMVVPEGYVLVPVEPTRTMLHRAYDNNLMQWISRQSTGHDCAAGIWEAMLAAAPTPEPASPWISVEDRLPTIPDNHLHADRPVLVDSNGQTMLAHLCRGKVTGRQSWDMSEKYWDVRGWFCAEDGRSYEPLTCVTAWMPLP